VGQLKLYTFLHVTRHRTRQKRCEIEGWLQWTTYSKPDSAGLWSHDG